MGTDPAGTPPGNVKQTASTSQALPVMVKNKKEQTLSMKRRCLNTAWQSCHVPPTTGKIGHKLWLRHEAKHKTQKVNCYLYSEKMTSEKMTDK